MLFQTAEFAILLGITWFCFQLSSGRNRVRVLLLASITFYIFSGPVDTLVFLAMAIITFATARRLSGTNSRTILLALLILLFTNLATFKYSTFIYDNFNALLRGLQLPFVISPPALWLPLGISFYTFQLAAYAVDVYRGDLKYSDDLVQFMTYIMFFGQLVAGPIMRGKDFFKQLQTELNSTNEDVRAAAYLIVRGLLKKIVLADRLAALVDPMFQNVAALDHASTWIAGYLFAFQIYLDFSGYTDIGLGLGRLFGLRLSANFLSPYISHNPSEFWRRWHVTLSTWLRDYLYIPLGGNRGTALQHRANLFLTMLLGGLWHGAAWTFVLWGAYQGSLLVLHKLWRKPRRASVAMPGGLSLFLNFQAMTLGWMIFRADEIGDVWHMWGSALNVGQWATWGAHLPLITLVAGLFILHILEWYADNNQATLVSRWRDVPAPLRGLTYTLICWLIILSFKPAQPFIYFRF